MSNDERIGVWFLAAVILFIAGAIVLLAQLPFGIMVGALLLLVALGIVAVLALAAD